MAKVQIERLPNEILMKIFGYLERRWQLSVTCKTFYYVCCKLEANVFAARISGRAIMNDRIFTSLMSTARQFDELRAVGIVNESMYARVLQVLAQHRDNIGSLHLATVQLSKSQLTNLLNAASSVNQVVMKSVAIKARDKEAGRSRGIRKLEDTPKSGAKSIEIASVRRISLDQRCDRSLLSLLNDFPCDSLDAVDLRFPTNDMRALQQFLRQQSHLKRLAIYTNFIHSLSLAHLRLTHLAIESRTISVDALQSQRSSLTHLSIISFPLNDDEAFEQVCRCARLEVLKVFVGSVSSDKMRAMARLENLEELTVRSAVKFAEGQLAALCSIKFDALLKLELLLPNFPLRDENLIELAQSLPRLVQLRIECVSINQLFAVLEHFAGLECLNAIINSRFDEISERLSRIDWISDGKVRRLSVGFKKLTNVESSSVEQRMKAIFPNVAISRRKL